MTDDDKPNAWLISAPTPTPDVAARAAAELAEMLQNCPPGTVVATERLMHTIEEGYRAGVPELAARADAILASSRADAIVDELVAIWRAIEALGWRDRMRPGEVINPMVVSPQRVEAIREEVIARVEVRALEQADAELVATIADHTQHPDYDEAEAGEHRD